MESIVNFFKKGGILLAVVLAIILAIICGQFFPAGLTRVFVTFNDIFGQFLSFCIPLIIVGLVAPAIADLGSGSAKWLGATAAIAYGSTLFAGFLTYFVCVALFPTMLAKDSLAAVEDPSSANLTSSFTIEMPAVITVMGALILSFVLGIGMSLVSRGVMRKAFVEFRAIITRLIQKVIIPLLPLHIFGIFLNMTQAGAVGKVIVVLLTVVIVVLVLEVVILVTQYLVGGLAFGINPFKALWTMLPAYLTALGTSSSAATIPVTLRQVKKMGVPDAVASFTVPLCATIHLAGSTSKITAFSLAIMITTGFNDAQVALMSATYIALESFGTATNVTGDGAISLLIARLSKGRLDSDDQKSVLGFAEKADLEAGRNHFDPEKYLEDIK